MNHFPLYLTNGVAHPNASLEQYFSDVGEGDPGELTALYGSKCSQL
jgi:hypothetical protein